MDIALWIAVGTMAAVLAVLVLIYSRWSARQQKATVTVAINRASGVGPTFEVTMRNTGNPEIVVAEPAKVYIFERRLGQETPVPLAFQVEQSGRDGAPCHLRPHDEVVSSIAVSQLADVLRLKGCMTYCRVQAEYRDRRGQAFWSPPCTMPVEMWLPDDAFARTQVRYRPQLLPPSRPLCG